MVDYPPPESILKPLKHEYTFLCGPGPTNVAPRVCYASSLQVYSIFPPLTISLLNEIQEGLRYVFQTKNSLTYAVCASGMAGMETAILNLVERGDKFMSLLIGYWGPMAADIGERCGAEVVRVEGKPGVPFTLEQIEKALSEHKPSVLYVCQSDSSTGLLQPVEGIGPLCHKYNCLLVVDTVASLGAAPFFMDRWEVDVCFTATQKALGCPPGLAPISFSPRARAKIDSRKTKPQSFIFDVNMSASYWGVDGQARKYHHTPSTTLMFSLREALSMIAQEGLESMWKRHKSNVNLFCKEIEKMGLELNITNPDLRLPTVTSIKVPEGIKEPGQLNKYCMEKHNFEIGASLPPLTGKVWRVGLMGHNSNETMINEVVKVLKDGLASIGYTPKLKADL